MPTSSQHFAGPSFTPSRGPRKRKPAPPRSSRNVRLHEGRIKQPGVPGPGPSGRQLPRPASTNPLLLGPHIERTSAGLTVPSLLGLTRGQVQEQERKGVRASSLHDILRGILDERNAPSAVQDLIVAASLSPIGPEAFIAKLGLSGAAKLVEAARAIRVSEDAARGAEAGSGVARALSRNVVRKAGEKATAKAGRLVAARAAGQTGIRAALKQAAAKAEPAAVQAARQGAKQAVEKLPQGVRTASKVAAKGAAYPIRHPFTTPLAAEVPTALIHGDPEAFLGALEGRGTLAAITNAISSGVPSNVAGNALKDALALPANALPSVYLPAAGAVEAAQGDPKRLEGLVHGYLRTGFIPDLLRGDAGAALQSVEAHPLFAALQAGGVTAVVGRGAGAALRGASRGKIAGTQRPDITIEGYPSIRETGRRYSPDAIRQLFQRGGEAVQGKRGKDPFVASEGKAKRLLRERVDRFVYEREQLRRGHRREVTEAVEKARPKSEANAGVVSLAVQRIIRDPSTFASDLKTYRDKLEAAFRSGELTKSEAMANRALVKQIDKGLRRASPADVVEAANAFIQLHADLSHDLISKGLLDPHQAHKAAAIPFARIHMGASHGRPEKLIGRREAGLAETKARTKADAKAHVAGAKESVGVAKQKLAAAESGWVAAERSVATLRANLPTMKRGDGPRPDLQEVLKHIDHIPEGLSDENLGRLLDHYGASGNAKSADLRVRANALVGIQRRQQTLEVARKRLDEAKAELGTARIELKRRAKEAVDKRSRAVKGAENALSAARREPAQVLDREGNPLSLEQIHAEMERHGVEPPGFLTHRPGAKGAGAFYRNFYPERQRLPKQRRTGESASRGTFDASYEALTEQAARTRSIADATDSFDEFVKRFGKPLPKEIANFNDARRALRDPEHFGLTLPQGVEFVPFRTAPFLALRQELEAAAKHQGLLDPEQEATLEALPSKAIAEAQRPGSGPVVLIPKLVVARMEEHTQRLPGGLKAFQAATGAFKSAILPTSPSWILGNALDAGIRTMLSATGPSDVILGRRLVKRLPKGAQESIVTGAHFASFEHIQTHREASQFADSKLAPLARAIGTVRRTPGPKQLIDAYLKYRDTVFAWNSKYFERLPQYGAVGKEARRELQATRGRWHHALLVGDQALNDLAKGLHGTDKQIAYAKAVEQVFGNWGKNGPEARRLLSSVAPFWMWARAATRFVALTMPAHHPVTTGLIAAASEMTEKERQRFGLDKFGPEPLLGFLQGGLPINGGVSPWAKYSSFGVFADYPGFLANVVLPQVSGPLAALQGLKWTGDKLVDSEGRPVSDTDRVRIALGTQLEAMVPFMGLYQRLKSGGVDKALNPAHAYPSSTINYLRGLSNSQQITVPIKGTGSSTGSGSAADLFSEGGTSNVDPSQLFSRPSSSGVDPAQLFAR